MFTLIPRNKDGRGEANGSHPFEVLRRLDHVFDRLYNGYPAVEYANSWGAELKETEKEVVVAFDAPGFEANEFEIQANEESVSIAAEHPTKEGNEPKIERSLKRHVAFPVLVDPNKVEAKYRSGVLELRFAKAETAKWKKIQVKGE